jgi:hypothetical protein
VDLLVQLLMLEIFLEEQVDHRQVLELTVDQELEVLEVVVELLKLIQVQLQVLLVDQEKFNIGF